MYKIYKLQKKNENENVIEIEFAFNYDNYIYSIEDYIEGKEPTFITNSNKILKKEEKHGKVRIAYDVTNINIILLSFKPTPNTRNIKNISYQFKYKSYVSINDYVEYLGKLDVKLNIADHNNYVVELQNPFYGHQMNNFSIHYTIYKKSPLTGTLTSIYMPNEYERYDDKEMYKYYVKAGTFETAQNEQYNNISISYRDDYNISMTFPEIGVNYYFKGVIYGVDSNGEEFKIAYNLLEVSQRSRNVIVMEFGTEMITYEGGGVAYVFSGQEHLFISQITKQQYVDFSKHPITAHWDCTIYTGNMDNSTDYRENDKPLIN